MQRPFPGRLYHAVPGWVEEGAVFHIRIRCREDNIASLVTPETATALLESARFYCANGRWYVHLFLLMPDHLHALISFHREDRMSAVIGDWKRFQSLRLGIRWQEGFFDHRIRNDKEFIEKAMYIRRNPVVRALCRCEADWRWILEKTR